MKKLPIVDSGTDVKAIQKLPINVDREAAIRDAIITSLGRPPGLYRVAVVPLWQGHYRVNVMIGPDATSICIPHSYFVVVGDDGAIMSSTPPILRLHP
jgi:hypothetical protein